MMKLKDLSKEPWLKRVVWKALQNKEHQPQKSPISRVKIGMQLSSALMKMKVQWLMKREGIGQEEAISYLNTKLHQSKRQWARRRGKKWRDGH